MNAPVLKDWIGREQKSCDTIDARQLQLMQGVVTNQSALENRAVLPPLWTWLYFPDVVPMSGLGEDGHPERGEFLPPVPLPRRMWAGGRLEFKKLVRAGDKMEKTSRILGVEEKSGRTGRLCFVAVEHIYSVYGDTRIREEQDLVYRESARGTRSNADIPEAPVDAMVSETIEPEPVMLFRYSALTYNGHRIHYDRDYCRDIEGYDGLVVHGPLIATLLADLADRYTGHKGPMRRFAYRAVSPLFDTQPFTINARMHDGRLQLWAAGKQGNLAMQAEASYE